MSNEVKYFNLCFVTRAVNLELVEDLISNSFLNALKRFTARRGRCTVISSDNATNFIGARNELRDLYRAFQSQHIRDKLSRTCATEGIVWKNIPPKSPHFGGL